MAVPTTEEINQAYLQLGVTRPEIIRCAIENALLNTTTISAKKVRDSASVIDRMVYKIAQLHGEALRDFRTAQPLSVRKVSELGLFSGILEMNILGLEDEALDVDVDDVGFSQVAAFGRIEGIGPVTMIGILGFMALSELTQRFTKPPLTREAAAPMLPRMQTDDHLFVIAAFGGAALEVLAEVALRSSDEEFMGKLRQAIGDKPVNKPA
jgi:hypothetical protein